MDKHVMDNQSQHFCNPEQHNRPAKPWFQPDDHFDGLCSDGHKSTSAVINERAVRATAGLVLATTAVAFAVAHSEQIFMTIWVVTVAVGLDFARRLFCSLAALSPYRSPGIWRMQHLQPEWVGITQKRFARSLGLLMATKAWVRAVNSMPCSNGERYEGHGQLQICAKGRRNPADGNRHQHRC